MTIEIQWFRIHVQSYNNPEKKPRESEEDDDGPTAESNWDAVWAGLLFHSGQQEKETIKL